MDITHGQPSGSRPNPQQRSVQTAYRQAPAPTLGLRDSEATVTRAAAAGGDSVELSGKASAERARALVAAKVSQAITLEGLDPEAANPSPAAGQASAPRPVLPMYRNPALKNSVATELAIGKLLDAQA